MEHFPFLIDRFSNCKCHYHNFLHVMLIMTTMLGQPMSLILLISVSFSLLIHLSVYEKGGWVGSDP